MGRGGSDKMRDEPERRCIVTGESAPKAGLLRFVVGPDERVVPDLAGRLPGRGIYVSASRDALAQAVRRNLFARAARAKVSVDPTLAETVEAGLARRLIDTISLARKAGEAVSGLEKVKEWLVSGQAAVLVQALDGSAREKARLRPPAGPESRIDGLTAQELGLAFGRERAIHGALSAGGLARRALEEAARLSGLRGQDEGQFGGVAAGKDTKDA
ncbi:MAG: RNA-binding protein [Gemmobacter sp.]